MGDIKMNKDIIRIIVKLIFRCFILVFPFLFCLLTVVEKYEDNLFKLLLFSIILFMIFILFAILIAIKFTEELDDKQ